MTELTATTTPVPPQAPRWSSFARTVGGVDRDRGQGAARPDARPSGVRDPDHLPRAARRLRADGRDGSWRQITPSARRDDRASAGPAIGQGIFAALLMLMTLQVVFLAAVVDRRRDLARAREADPRSARHDADQLARDRHRQAALGAGLRLPADRGVDPADGRGVRVRRRRPGGRDPRLHRADRRRPSASGSFGLFCSSLVKRTTASTAITIFGVLAITIGTVFVLVFWQAMADLDDNGNQRPGCSGSERRPSSPG